MAFLSVFSIYQVPILPHEHLPGPLASWAPVVPALSIRHPGVLSTRHPGKSRDPGGSKCVATDPNPRLSGNKPSTSRVVVDFYS